MPKPSVSISDDFANRLRRFERSRSKLERLFARGDVTRHDVNLFYEGIFLKTVTSFEGLMEELFLGLLTGGIIAGPKIHPRVTFRSAAVARDVMLGGKAYVDWLPYHHTQKRANAFFRGGLPFCFLDKTDAKALERILTIRHAVAHHSRFALGKFEDEVIGTAPLLRFERSPAGYLRSVLGAAPPRTQYEDIAGTCALMARKLCA